jgi:hypothetical protein
MSKSQASHLVNETQFDVAYARLKAGEYLHDDVNLVLAWLHRVNKENGEMIREIMTLLDGIPQGRA